MSQKTDEEKEKSTSQTTRDDSHRPPPEKSFQSYIKALNDYAIDWLERNPEAVFKDERNPISYLQTEMHQLYVKYQKLCVLPDVEIPDEEGIEKAIGDVSSKLTALDMTLKNIKKLEKEQVVSFPDDFVAKFNLVRKLLKPLAKTIAPLVKFDPTAPKK